MMDLLLIITVVMAFALADRLTRRLMAVSWLGEEWLDHPNDRSLHQRPTPRSGGIAIVSSVALVGMVVGFVYLQQQMLYLLGGASLLVLVAYWDDRGHVAARYRLLAQLMAASILVSGGVPEAISVFGTVWRPTFFLNVVLFILFVVWMTNLYNFRDGMDGFAGGMAVFGFGTLAILGTGHHAPGYVLFNLGVAAAAGGFLRSNFPPAGIFMGDIGSTALGFLAAGSIIWGLEEGIFSPLAGTMPFAVFIVDATVTLMQRMWRRERVWEAHRSHYYQRLVRLGWSHRRVVRLEYGLMGLSCTAALTFDRLGAQGQIGLAVGLGAVFAFAMWGVSRYEGST